MIVRILNLFHEAFRLVDACYDRMLMGIKICFNG